MDNMILDILTGFAILAIVVALLGIGFAIGYMIGQMSCYEDTERKDPEED